jgi:membrane protein CcdC involved in cytochrome C biogenesis
MQHAGQAAIPVILMLFLIYRRIRRTVGFQPYHARKLKVRIGIFGALAIALFAAGFLHPIVWAADAGGLIAGGVLAIFAVRHNRFEWQGATLYYRTHAAIQAIVVALFVSRVAYRLFSVYQQSSLADSNGAAQTQLYTRDPWTAAVFFVMAAFYIGYYFYILRNGPRHAAPDRADSTGTQAS